MSYYYKGKRYAENSDGYFYDEPVNWSMYGTCTSTVLNAYTGLRQYYSGHIPLDTADGYIWIPNVGLEFTIRDSSGTVLVTQSTATTVTETINGTSYVKITIPDNASYFVYLMGSSTTLGDATSDEIKATFDGRAVYLTEPLNQVGNKSGIENMSPSDAYEQYFDYRYCKNPLNGKHVYMMGDSIGQYSGGTTPGQYGFLAKIAKQYNCKISNKCTGGAAYEYSSSDKSGDYDSVSGCARVNQLVSSEEIPDYVLLEFSGNLNGTEGETTNTADDTTTMCGAVRYCIETLQAYLPYDKAIGIILQSNKSSISDSAYRARQLKVKAIAEEYSVPVLDMFIESGINKTMTVDGDHWSYDATSKDYPALAKAARVIAAFLMRI